MNTSLLEQELAPLNARITQARETLAAREAELRATEAKLETFAADRLRFDLLREACDVLDRLGELQAGQLFWGDVPEIKDPAGHIGRLRSGIACFDEKIRGVLERQANLRIQANRCLEELNYLDDEIHDAYARDERREEEFAIERELSPVPHHPSVMPWCHDDESDRRYRRTLRSAMLFSLLFAIIIHLVNVPVRVRPAVVPIPERLAMMVRQEHKKPLPVKKPAEKKKEEKAAKQEEKKQADQFQEKPARERPKAARAEQTATPEKAENVGVLAFKDSFKDLIDETAVPRLGTEARLSNSASQTAGQVLASRSLVAMQTGGRPGGGNAAVSRNAGSGGIGTTGAGRSVGGGSNDARLGRAGNGFTQVKSAIASAGPGTKDTRPLGSGARPGRTEEEIQILFDRYKAALYRIYNTELRKDPTLRGKMVLRVTIEPSGIVSLCAVESCNMDAPGFSAQIVERVKKFNFGAKDGVPKTTILYPIDFLPAR